MKLDFTEAVITQDTLHIDVDLGIGGDLTLVTRPGIVVDTDGLTGRLSEVKVRPVADPHAPVTCEWNYSAVSAAAASSRDSRDGRSGSGYSASLDHIGHGPD